MGHTRYDTSLQYSGVLEKSQFPSFMPDEALLYTGEEERVIR